MSVRFVALGVLALTLGAQVGIPPYTLQSLAAVVLGALSPLGIVACAAYVLLGAMGAPVFAGFASGLGPSSGYLVGLIAAAALVRVLPLQTWPKRALAFGIAHALILLLGAAWLSYVRQLPFMAGVSPYVFGAIVKSALGAAFVEPARLNSA